MARLTDHEVDLIRDLAEDTLDPDSGEVVLPGLTFSQIAAKFEISAETARSIVQYRRRASTLAGFRERPERRGR